MCVGAEGFLFCFIPSLCECVWRISGIGGTITLRRVVIKKGPIFRRLIVGRTPAIRQWTAPKLEIRIRCVRNVAIEVD
jgi:hypothetical protein